MSLQSIASLAAKNRLSMQETAERLAEYFHQLGVDYIFDITLARHICLLESAREFVEHRKCEEADGGSKRTTMLSSTCPGFVCYAEKSQGSVLVPLLSKVKSPQQIMGLLVKNRLDHNGTRVNSSQVYHISLMPCYDKKLEASRNDNRIEASIPEVDCVITPVEVEKLLEAIDFLSLPRRKLDQLVPEFNQPSSDSEPILQSHYGSGSGGYAENIFKLVAAELYGLRQRESTQLSWRVIRNLDFLEVNLYENGNTSSSESSGKALISFAILNGFRNIQNLVTRLKRKAWKYDYVEVSACPKGCLNGGAQIRDIAYEPTVNTSVDLDPVSIAFEQVQNLYDRLPKTAHSIELISINQADAQETLHSNQRLYSKLQIDETFAKQFRTHFYALEKTFNILNSNW